MQIIDQKLASSSHLRLLTWLVRKWQELESFQKLPQTQGWQVILHIGWDTSASLSHRKPTFASLCGLGFLRAWKLNSKRERARQRLYRLMT